MDPSAPNTVFRWEAASGLEHGCYDCATKMNSPKALQTCYGIHSTPCYRYHQTMHAIGTSHNCFSCIQADELHRNRHRQIAELVAEYKAVGESEQADSSPNPRKSLGELAINVRRPHTPQPAPRWYAPDEDSGADDEYEDNQTATDTTTSDSMVPLGKISKAEKRALKRAAKSAKSQKKAAKNQAKYSISIKTEDVELVNTVLHGDVTPTAETHPLAQDKSIEEVIERNMGFISNIQAHKKQLTASIALRRKSERERRKATLARSPNKNRRLSAVSHSSHNDGDEEDDETETLLTAVLTKLGIDREHLRSGGGNAGGKRNAGKGPCVNGALSITSGPSSASSKLASRREIVGNLKNLVMEDLEKFENDHRETCIRAGGFWRYVNNQVFERMTKIAGEVDWKTGAKLKERQ